MLDKKFFGNQVRKIRKELGLQQEEFGQLFGVHASAVSMIEKGARTVSLDLLIELSEAVDMPPEYFLGLGIFGKENLILEKGVFESIIEAVKALNILSSDKIKELENSTPLFKLKVLNTFIKDVKVAENEVKILYRIF